jgi:hypothetical protein
MIFYIEVFQVQVVFINKYFVKLLSDAIKYRVIGWLIRRKREKDENAFGRFILLRIQTGLIAQKEL